MNHFLFFILISCNLSMFCQQSWQPIGNMPEPKQNAQTLQFRNAHSIVEISVLSQEIIRIRYYPKPDFVRDHSYAVVKQDFPDREYEYSTSAQQSVIQTKALEIHVQHQPFRIEILDRDGNSLDKDDPARGMISVDASVKVWKRLREQEQIYGLGEKGGSLSKRGWKLGGYSFSMWHTDAFSYDASTDPLYAGVPFYMVLHEGKAHGIFLDNSFRTNFDIGKEDQGLLSFSAPGGELDYYVIQGPDPKDVIRRFTDLTGRMPLPARWTLGYHQSRYSYFSEEEVRFIGQNFRMKHIPADAIFIDIHHQQGFAPFTWDQDKFPDPKQMISDMRKQGLRIITPVDPHPKILPDHWVYQQGIAGDHFVKWPDGRVFEGAVWPSRDPVNPQNSVFPDFSRAATRLWYGDLFQERMEQGVAGIWIDMNEPAVFRSPSGTMPLDIVHDNDGLPTDHREIHNVYGLLSCQATFEGLQRIQANSRPFILTRGAYTGTQRYAAVWPGDDVSSWASLREKIPMLCGMGISGLTFVGADIGGYATSPSAELMTRWLQMGVFFPYMRNHSDIRTKHREPWVFGLKHEEINREAIELRYKLLPQIYNEFHKASETGIPIMRPLFLDFPTDPATYNMGSQFLFGDDLLVAPVLQEGADQHRVYLPEGSWYDLHTGKEFGGSQSIEIPVDLRSIPVFAKAGSFVFRQPVVQHTGEMDGNSLHVYVYPGTASEASFYEDDGESLAYQEGGFLKRHFVQKSSDTHIELALTEVRGSYRPSDRSLVWYIHRDQPVNKVSINGEEIPKAKDDPQSEINWEKGNGPFVKIRMTDRWEVFELKVE